MVILANTLHCTENFILLSHQIISISLEAHSRLLTLDGKSIKSSTQLRRYTVDLLFPSTHLLNFGGIPTIPFQNPGLREGKWHTADCTGAVP